MNLLIRIFEKKFIFKSIKKVDLIIFGPDKFKFDKNIKYSYYDNEEINLRYSFSTLILYLKNFFKKKKITLSDAYFLSIFNSYDCKISLGNDREQGVFKFKRLFPNKISIAYQFGYWFKELIKLGQSVIKDRSTDYYLMFDERTKKFTEPVLKSNFFIAGSVSSNEKIFKSIRKKYDFMFISNFRSEKTLKAKNLVNCSGFMLSALSKYCDLNNKNFCIARVSTRNDKKRYKKDLIDKENNFLKKNAKNYILQNLDSFKLAQQSEVSICTHSNLGYQLLARGNKVLFLNTDRDIYNWHFTDSCPFWYKGNDLSEIYKKLDYISNISKNNWKKIITKNSALMKFDSGNTLLKSLIFKIINQLSKKEVRH